MTGPGSPWPRSLIDPVRLRGQVAADPCVRCGADTGPAEVGRTDRPQRTPQAPALCEPCWRALCDWLWITAERA